MFSFLRRKSGGDQKFIGIAVTGTYGKTVVVNALASILRENGASVVTLSSDGFSRDDRDIIPEITSKNIDKKTFDSIYDDLNGTPPTFFILEVPIQKFTGKTFGSISFDSVVLTSTENWRQFIKDYKTMDHGLMYLIGRINNNGLLTVNGDDPELVSWLQNKSKYFDKSVFCSWVSVRDLKDKKFSLHGISFLLHNQVHVESKLIGKHNFMNLYLAAQTCLRYMDISSVVNGIDKIETPEGSFDMYNKDPFRIIIDSARSSKQLGESLKYIYQTKSPNAALITVLGSPYYEGEQRKTNAELATEYSDIVLFAPNDPNNQHVSNINSELHQYGQSKGGTTVERFYSTEENSMTNKDNFKNRLFTSVSNKVKPLVSYDYHDYNGRLDSITSAMQIARNGDVIYIPGKGSDRSILFDNIEYEWSDYEAARLGMIKSKRG